MKKLTEYSPEELQQLSHEQFQEILRQDQIERDSRPPVWAICEADDKIRESINQASIITGGSLGGSFAGALGRAAGLGAYCGPYAVPCIAGIVIIGTIIGGMLGDMVSDTFEEEVAEFIRWELL